MCGGVRYEVGIVLGVRLVETGLARLQFGLPGLQLHSQRGLKLRRARLNLCVADIRSPTNRYQGDEEGQGNDQLAGAPPALSRGGQPAPLYQPTTAPIGPI